MTSGSGKHVYYKHCCSVVDRFGRPRLFLYCLLLFTMIASRLTGMKPHPWLFLFLQQASLHRLRIHFESVEDVDLDCNAWFLVFYCCCGSWLSWMYDSPKADCENLESDPPLLPRSLSDRSALVRSLNCHYRLSTRIDTGIVWFLLLRFTLRRASDRNRRHNIDRRSGRSSRPSRTAMIDESSSHWSVYWMSSRRVLFDDEFDLSEAFHDGACVGSIACWDLRFRMRPPSRDVVFDL